MNFETIVVSFVLLFSAVQVGVGQSGGHDVQALDAALNHARSVDPGPLALDAESTLDQSTLEGLAAVADARVGQVEEFFHCPDTPMPRCVSRTGTGIFVSLKDWDRAGDSAQVVLVMRYIHRTPEETPLHEQVDRVYLERGDHGWEITDVEHLSIT